MKRVFSFCVILLGLAIKPALANDTVYYYHTDAQGTAVVVTDASHNVVERTWYGPYGEVLNRPLRDGPGYTGHEEDAATGLDNMQQRYYDPANGRFPSPDPMEVDTRTGSNFNRYAYAADNPYRYVDPDGRAGKDCGADGGCGKNPDKDNDDQARKRGNDGSIEGRFPGEASGIRGMSISDIASAEDANDSASAQQPNQPVLPNNPSGLGSDWEDVTPKGGQNPKIPKRYRGPKGTEIEFDPADPSKGGWGGRDHWHEVNPANGKRVGGHLAPGAPIPGPDGNSQRSMMDRMRSITPGPILKFGTAGVVIYIIIDEGSRLYLPRNFVPLP